MSDTSPQDPPAAPSGGPKLPDDFYLGGPPDAVMEGTATRWGASEEPPEPPAEPPSRTAPREAPAPAAADHATAERERPSDDAGLNQDAGRREAAERHAEMMEQQIRQAGRPRTQSEADHLVNLHAEAKAARFIANQAFADQCARVAGVGKKEFADFDQQMRTLWSATGGLDANRTLIDAAFETGAAHRVLHALGSNPEEAQRIAELPPHRMGAALVKLASKPAAPSSAPRRAAPPAAQPSPTGTMKDFDAWFEGQRRRP